jgi:hypothetical protein
VQSNDSLLLDDVLVPMKTTTLKATVWRFISVAGHSGAIACTVRDMKESTSATNARMSSRRMRIRNSWYVEYLYSRGLSLIDVIGEML